jgi:hypothetical protein
MKKNIKKYTSASVVLVLLLALFSGIAFQSCDDNESSGGNPTISYVRVTNPDKSDSLLDATYLGSTIAIIGENLQNVGQIFFNDQQAYVNGAYVTSTCIIVTVPSTAPVEMTNQMFLISRDKQDTLVYPFLIKVPAPVISSISCEMLKAGATAVIYGNYFMDNPLVPIQVIFPEGLAGTIISRTDTKIEVTVPDGVGSGNIIVKSAYGSTPSKFYINDTRNDGVNVIQILNYDNLNNTNVWRAGVKRNDSYSIDGNYLMLKGTYAVTAGGTSQETEDFAGGGFVSEFWADADGRPEGNFFPSSGLLSDYSFVFDAYVIEWTGQAHLEICWGPWQANVSGIQNTMYWGNINARGFWMPWADTEDGTFSTDGWITVKIPMADMKYDRNGAAMAFDKALTGSLTFWVATPSSEAILPESKVEMYIDNVRLVKNN